MLVEKLPSKLSILRDLNSAGYILQEDETAYSQKAFTVPILKLTETITDIDGNERTAIINANGYNVINGFISNVLMEIFGSYGFYTNKASTEWEVQ